MSQFAPGVAKTAIAPIVAKPSGINCEAELFLGPDDATKVASSGLVPFVSTGAAKNVSLPITMPGAPGSYRGYIDVFAGGLRFLAYKLTEDVVIAAPKLILTAQNMPSYLWSGSISEIVGGRIERVQSWGICNITEQPVTLEPLISNQLLLQYVTGYGEAYYGPFLIDLPATAGEYVWDAGAEKLGSAQAINLAKTDNKQRLIGTLKSQNYQANRIAIQVTDSKSISGKGNVGQYFIGQRLNIKVDVPINVTQYALSVGDSVESDCILKMDSQVATWIGDFVRRQRLYPDSAYVFSSSGNIDPVTFKLHL
ncbi:MAG TPA: hypothetical protein VMV84_04690, partial [Dehalococcoidales bacterium]|nr:hypothetical protein [Dehalococcoidales bacterium]